MHALAQQGPESTASEDVRDPMLPAGDDAIVRIDAVTTGHEAVGTVEAVGPGVKTIAVGDRVLVSGIASSGRCSFAELVRVPLADTSTCKVADELTDGQLLMFAKFFRPATRRSAAAPAR